MPRHRRRLADSTLESWRIARAILVAGLAVPVVAGTWEAAHGVRHDFLAIFQGAQAVQAGTSPYDTPLGGYIYPPLLAVLQSALVPLGIGGASLLWGVLNVLMLCWSCRITYRVLADRLRLPRDGRAGWVVALASVVTLASPVQQLLAGGQTDAVMLLGFVLALAAVDTRPVASGLALGFITNIKYMALATVPYLLLRRRFSAALAAVSGTVLFALGPALVVGWTPNLAYLRRAVAGFLTLFGLGSAFPGAAPLRALHPVTFSQSISLTSAAARLGVALAESPRGAIGLAAGLAAAVLGLVTLIYRAAGVPLWAGRGGPAEGAALPRAILPLEWMSVLVGVALFSPQYLSRHMVVLIPLLMILWTAVLVPRPGVPRWPLVVGAIVLLLGTSQPSWGGSGPGAPRRVWRAGGGPSWCLLASYLIVLWSGLRYARAGDANGAAGARGYRAAD